MVAALIQFTQGLNVGAPGQALYGVTGTPVVVSNSDNTGVAKWVFTVIDAPPSSSLTPGVVQSGTTPTWTWVPDTTDMVEIRLDVFDASGQLTATDFRCFGVKRTSGRIIPAFTAVANALNFLGQLRGWASIMEAWLDFLDGLTGGGGGGTQTVRFLATVGGSTSSSTPIPTGSEILSYRVRVVNAVTGGTPTVELGVSGTPAAIFPTGTMDTAIGTTGAFEADLTDVPSWPGGAALITFGGGATVGQLAVTIEYTPTVNP